MRQSCLPALLVLLSTSLVYAGDGVDYLTEIKPLLSEKCYSCHGSLKQEADLRLETRSFMLDHGVVSPGEPDASELLTRIQSKDEDRMPPPEDGSALQPDQIDLLRRWIRQGAPAPEETPPPAPTEHWAFQPIAAPSLSLPTDTSIHPIDALLDAKRIQHQLHSVSEADRPLLIRRLYLDLVGLPPTVQQLRDDRPWEQIVDELLASPEYGQRWARHWMDVWRYSDWYGLGAQIRNSQKHIWHWRDWIVDSLCDDKGYDRMMLEMLAGDELAPDDPQAVTATGFLARNYYLFNRTTWLDNTIEHTGKAFLGLTLNCAKCHDHKYDPISQLDYYRFRAILEPHQVRLDPIPGVSDFEQDGLPRVFDDSLDQETFLHRKGDPKNPDKDHPIAPGVPAILARFAPPIQSVDLPPTAFAPGTRDYVQQDAIRNAQAAIDAAKEELVMAEQRLAEQPPEQDTTENDESSPFEISDSFDQPNPKLWQIIGDGWQYREGTLQQTKSTREQQTVRLLAEIPRDFEVDCRYTTTGGDTYKSVTFRFDQSEDGDNASYVYTSAHAPGPKVQVALTRNGKDIYPAEGRKAKPITVGQQYHLRMAVRDTLVNVWLDDEFVVAYQLPDRHDGFFGISGFDAIVAFDEITIKSLASDTKLTAAKNQPAASALDAETAVKAATMKLESAIARLHSVDATIQADEACFVSSTTGDDAVGLSRIAAEKQWLATIADAKYRTIADAADPKKVKAAKDQITAAENKLQNLDKTEPKYDSLRGSRKALETPAHKEPDYPAVYSPVSSGRRLALARWMTSPENPLTARVAVNHVWMRHFGTPLVESVFDFGLRSKKPLHADLLDYLADDFIRSGWSFKHLHRLIVTSKAYRMKSSGQHADSSTGDSADNNPHRQTHATDPENKFYWRFNAQRMESQLVRDSLLSLGEKLDPTRGGPSADPGPTTTRRSLYLKHSRDQQDKFLAMFDDADILQCYRRSESIVPQQALALSNSQLAISMSGEIAQRITASMASESATDFIDTVFFELLCREPTDLEQSECIQFIEAMQQLSELKSMNESDRTSRIRARLVGAIINHNDFVTIR